MAFCSNCGTQLDENSTVCPSCDAMVRQNDVRGNTLHPVYGQMYLKN